MNEIPTIEHSTLPPLRALTTAKDVFFERAMRRMVKAMAPSGWIIGDLVAMALLVLVGVVTLFIINSVLGGLI